MKLEALNIYITSHQRPLIPTQRISSCLQPSLQCAQSVKVLKHQLSPDFSVHAIKGMDVAKANEC